MNPCRSMSCWQTTSSHCEDSSCSSALLAEMCWGVFHCRWEGGRKVEKGGKKPVPTVRVRGKCVTLNGMLGKDYIFIIDIQHKCEKKSFLLQLHQLPGYSVYHLYQLKRHNCLADTNIFPSKVCDQCRLQAAVQCRQIQASFKLTSFSTRSNLATEECISEQVNLPYFLGGFYSQH